MTAEQGAGTDALEEVTGKEAQVRDNKTESQMSFTPKRQLTLATKDETAQPEMTTDL